MLFWLDCRIFGVIDIAERPEVYYPCGHVGNFIGRSRNSWRHGKKKYLSLSRLLAVGSEGTLRLDRAFSAKDFDVAIEVVKGERTEAVRIPPANMFTLMVEHFGDAVLGKTPLLYPPKDAFHNMRAIDACFESVRTGRAVEIANNLHQGGVVS